MTLISLDDIPSDRPILIAGPTASGKSALALALAERQGGTVVNADAMQVFADWRVLTARPSAEEEARAAHALYGHVAWRTAYSTGDWLRDYAALRARRPIVTGGTGLLFRALTEGLADIPPTPPEVRAEAVRRMEAEGHAALASELSADVRRDLDLANPARVARAWEVQRATGRSIRAWQAETPPPLLPLDRAVPIVLEADRDWLAERIARRFDFMLDGGALDEVRAVLPRWNPALNAAQAIGAPDLVAHLRGEIDLATARDRAVAATRQYAKRQRTWFRRRMGGWTAVRAESLPGS
ncbi:tRNA (adenosine(37)-N6)-dimethylallyltransferase MiaA [Jannaschia sp. Os4]|uniref:tRNA (adenosine(37)-N6)-dimethylallyltransferase MiaA n=1 Tax=Jannaschia sp. Os4 TaxID=2807617 RepID=UPI001939FDD6|nr:tRNA (adenosine(37)-N6)-dimethylallyltransferase MiaA [Jannaschia sp. Os4]MBM2576662.1 tRNA (adenosine(37)-N6)-dimethylallyltransferase MiaA [Jannaschia sp. Os4]